jgi:hypothetical protein
MNPSFFKSLQGSGLRGRKAWFHAAFRKNPPSAAGLNQQEFNAAFAHAVTDCGNLLPPSRQS